MKIINKQVNDLVPYNLNNKTHDQTQIDNVAESIKQFGFVQPIVCDKNNVVVIGHCRLEAAKQLGMHEVPCICVNDLTNEQVRKLRIIDNKTNESPWDIANLAFELPDLDFSDFDLDFSDFDLSLGDKQSNEVEQLEDGDDNDDLRHNERERTYNAYNLYQYDERRVDGKYQMPIIEKQVFNAPETLSSFTNVINSPNESDKHCGVHFFSDDYKFERIWNLPYEYVQKLTSFECALSPDFSLYMDMPIAMKIWNVYRSRLVGQIMQDYGIKVVPTIQWAEPETFEFCFDGIEKGCICAISTIGVKRDPEATKIWEQGVTEMIKRIEPTEIWCYGGDIGYNFGDIPVVYFANENKVRLSNGKQRSK